MIWKPSFNNFIIAALALLASSAAWASDDGVWSVSKSSGEVWLTTQGAQQVSLGNDNVLMPGDTIRTGGNGRVLLTRGAETILIAPNSVIGLPTDAQDGMATTILQRAGSILLDVERRNVKHFEVETPYLAAVVKGTQFRVTIAAGSTKVDVSRGQVEVSDFKSGQIAQVTPGQSATSFANGKSGLHLSGSGTFAPIEQGRPRASTIQRVPVPKDGLHAPREAKATAVHVVSPASGAPVAPAAIRAIEAQKGAVASPKHSGVRISTALGEAKLNVGKATHGLAHGAVLPSGGNSAHKNTIWNDNKTADGNASSNSNAAAGSDSTSPTALSTTVTTAIGSANASANLASTSGSGGNIGTSNGNSGGNNNSSSGGNGHAGNQGKGNGNANSNGNGADANAWASWADGHGNGNNGNGKGNGNSDGNGHGSGNGNGKGKN